MLSPLLQICLRGPLAAACCTGRLHQNSCWADLLAQHWRGCADASAGRRRGTVASGPPAARPPRHCPRPRDGTADAAAGRTYRAAEPTRLRGGCAVWWPATRRPPPDTAGHSPRPAVRGCCADATAGRTYRGGCAALTPPSLLACCCSDPHPTGAHAAPRRR